MGNCFCGERKCEKHPKNKQNFVIVWGGNLKLNPPPPPPPPKALKKSLCLTEELLTCFTCDHRTLLPVGTLPTVTVTQLQTTMMVMTQIVMELAVQEKWGWQRTMATVESGWPTMLELEVSFMYRRSGNFRVKNNSRENFSR